MSGEGVTLGYFISVIKVQAIDIERLMTWGTLMLVELYMDLPMIFYHGGLFTI